jgi:gliding motility associated protien GldN
MRTAAALCMYIWLCVPAYAQQQNQVVQPPEMREANVLISKRQWRMIDLREKQNVVAMWPKNPLVKVLYNAVLNGVLVPYKNDSLRSAMPYEQFVKLGSRKDVVRIPNDPNDPDIYRTDTVITPFNPESDIKQLLIMEEWYFDQRHGTERVQIIAIAPLFTFRIDHVDLGLQPLCWLRYYDRRQKEKDLRQLLTQSAMYNKANDRSVFTYENWFEQRRFSSYIVKESNVHDISVMDDPEVKRNGLKALLMADKIRMLNSEREQQHFEY